MFDDAPRPEISKRAKWDQYYAQVLPYCLAQWGDNAEKSARSAADLADALLKERTLRYPFTS